MGFEVIDFKDVVTMPGANTALCIADKTFLVEQLLEKVKASLGATDINRKLWFDEGATCEVMQVNKGQWQKGKIRIVLEFCPDAPPTDLELEALRRETWEK